MSDQKKELAAVKKGIDDAQEAIKVGIMGLFTSAQDLLMLVKNQQKLSREQLQAITNGLDYLHTHYHRFNADLTKTNVQSSLVHGQAAPQAKKVLSSLENSTEQLNAVNQTIKEINQEIAKLPLITGQVPAGVTAAQLQAQAEILQQVTKLYYTEVNKTKEKLKSEYQASQSPAAKHTASSSRRPGKK